MITIEMAQAWYPVQDPVHGFDHILRVYHLAERIAAAEGADWEIVCAAVLLHDAVSPEEMGLKQERVFHQHASADFAAEVLEAEGWRQERIEAVQHCIRSHRFRDSQEAPATLEAKVLYDADKLDAIGAVGVARAVAYAARAGSPFFARPSEGFLKNGQTEAGELHSAYHEYLFKLRKLNERLFTPTGQAIGEERDSFMDAFFNRLVEEVEGEI